MVVDLERCQGHGKCYMVLPEIFEAMDDWGHARVTRSIGPDETEMIERAQRAIDGCPERALSWKADGPDGGTA